jgi:2,3-bisphosphoglycerate-independent phosphoglycerate mutase
MNNLELIKEISRTSPEKIILMVIDGLGGLPDPKTGLTELETARIPNLDALAARSICGMSDPVAPGITPGVARGTWRFSATTLWPAASVGAFWKRWV